MFKRTYFVNFEDKEGGKHWRLCNFYGWTFDKIDICKQMIANEDFGVYEYGDVYVTAFYRVK